MYGITEYKAFDWKTQCCTRKMYRWLDGEFFRGFSRFWLVTALHKLMWEATH